MLVEWDGRWMVAFILVFYWLCRHGGKIKDGAYNSTAAITKVFYIKYEKEIWLYEQFFYFTNMVCAETHYIKKKTHLLKMES